MFGQVTSDRAVTLQKAKILSKKKLGGVEWLDASSERDGPFARLTKPQNKQAPEQRPAAPGGNQASSGAEKRRNTVHV